MLQLLPYCLNNSWQLISCEATALPVHHRHRRCGIQEHRHEEGGGQLAAPTPALRLQPALCQPEVEEGLAARPGTVQQAVVAHHAAQTAAVQCGRLERRVTDVKPCVSRVFFFFLRESELWRNFENNQQDSQFHFREIQIWTKFANR